MDPDKALEAIRNGISDYRAGPESHCGAGVDIEALVSAMEDLDAWLHRGGYLPARWAPSTGSRYSR